MHLEMRMQRQQGDKKEEGGEAQAYEQFCPECVSVFFEILNDTIEYEKKE